MIGLSAVIITGLFKLVLAVVGIIAARGTLFWMDKHIEKGDTVFANWLAVQENKGIYYAGRFIAVAIIIGSAIS